MMFDDVKGIAQDMYKDMMKDAQTNANKVSMGRVNFVIEKVMPDGLVLKANSFNPVLLEKSFREFVKLVQDGGRKK